MTRLYSSTVLELRVIADRLHYLTDGIDDNVRPINDDEMAALLRNDLLAVLRKGKQFSLKFDVIRAAELVGADINERLVAERVFFGERVGLCNTVRY